MVDYWINAAVLIVSFLGMEGVAWFTHKYVMHGLLWNLHHDHHVPHLHGKGFFQRNDFFFLIFAIPGIICLFIGMLNNYNFLFWIGMGITAYGATYFLVHDIMIHQRFRLFRKTESTYFKAIRKAHKVHHKHLNKEDGECFGMLWVPMKYFKEAKTKQP